MAVNPALALHKAMRDRLLAHAPLVALIGASKVFDDVPQGTAAPYIHFGAAETRDWSTKDERGHEHFLALHVRSAARGRKETQDVIAEIETALDGQSLMLADHRLIALSLIFWTVQPEPEAGRYHGLARLRAATEPIS